MPKRGPIERAKKDKKEGKSASTQAGEFVREEVRAFEKGEGAAKSPKQAIAIGLSKARRAGVDLPPPKEDRASEATRKKAERDLEVGEEKGPI